MLGASKPDDATQAPLRLDLGAGIKKKAGYKGVDAFAFPGVDIVADLRKPWPWPDESVEEVHCSHFIEHLTALERVHFCNELYRVLKINAKATVITPSWSSSQAYGDPTHQWPPVSEFMFHYLDRGWRERNAPHTDKRYWANGYDCDFQCTWGFSLHPIIAAKDKEAQQFAVNFYKEACLETVATWIKR